MIEDSNRSYSGHVKNFLRNFGENTHKHLCKTASSLSEMFRREIVPKSFHSRMQYNEYFERWRKLQETSAGTAAILAFY